MTQLVEAQTDAGSILFEVTDATTAGPQRVTRHGGNVIAHLDERLDTALAAVRPAAATVLHTFTELGPGDVEIEFVSPSTPKPAPSSPRPGSPGTSPSS